MLVTAENFRLRASFEGATFGITSAGPLVSKFSLNSLKFHFYFLKPKRGGKVKDPFISPVNRSDQSARAAPDEKFRSANQRSLKIDSCQNEKAKNNEEILQLLIKYAHVFFYFFHKMFELRNETIWIKLVRDEKLDIKILGPASK